MEPASSTTPAGPSGPDNVYAPPADDGGVDPLDQTLDFTPRELKRLRNHSLNITGIGYLLLLGLVVNIVVMVMLATGSLETPNTPASPSGFLINVIHGVALLLIAAGVYGCLFRTSQANRTMAMVVLMILMGLNVINLAVPPYAPVDILIPVFGLLIILVALVALIGGRRLYGPDRLRRHHLSKRGLKLHREAWERRAAGQPDDGVAAP